MESTYREKMVRNACLIATTIILTGSNGLAAREPNRMINLWAKEAPGETTVQPGEALPRRPKEEPPATRIQNITQPRLAMFTPKRPNGTAVIVLPGGGYRYVVVDKEGAEVADWLNNHGVTVFVLHYRTKHSATTKDQARLPAWQRPLQDGQRAIRVVRNAAKQFGVEPDRIGVMGFSAGGQAAALVATRSAKHSYKPTDEIDTISCHADFLMLIYPWQLVDENNQLRPQIVVDADTPTTFIVHAHDDGATSLSSIEFYKELKRNDIASELHIFQSGGHGYGMRVVNGTNIHSWPDRATDWLMQRGMITGNHHGK